MKRFVGQRIARREDVRHLRGRAQFVPDLPGDGVLEVAFVRSQEAHAVIRGVEFGAALSVPGVAGVLTIDDCRNLSRPFTPNISPPGLQQFSWYALAGDRVRFAGDLVAAVAAVDRYSAEDAAELVDVDYESLPPVASPAAALAPDAPLLYPDWTDNVLFRRTFSAGDVEAAFRDAHLVVREQFTSGRYSGTPLEGRGCLARVDPATEKLLVWSSTQWPHPLRTTLADLLGRPESSIEVIAPDVGGGFGNKQHIFREELAVCLLALKLGRPVRWVEDRRENLLASVHARDQTLNVEAAVDDAGVIVGLRAAITADLGAATTYFVGIAPQIVTAISLTGPYRIHNYAYELRCVVTNKCPAGSYRGFGRATATMAMERTIDLIADRLGLDPNEVRRRNLVRDEEFPTQTATGTLLDSGRYLDTLEQALVLLEYDRWKSEQAEGRQRGRFIGIGTACLIEGTVPSVRGSMGRFGAWESATARLEPDGRLWISTGLSPHGQGLETALSQVAADVLGIRPDDVDVFHGNTAISPYGLGTFGGRGAAMGGATVTMAVTRVREKVLAIAAEMLEAAPPDLNIVDGRISVQGSPERGITVGDVAHAAYHRLELLPRGLQPGIVFTESFDPEVIDVKPDAAGRMNNYAGTSNAVHAAVVEVDVETGQVRVLKYVVVHDCGTLINPTIVEGQVAGGVAQGIGGALLEEFVYDDSGQCVTGSFMDYLIPTACEVPPIEVEHLETPAPYIPGGYKAAGEGGAIGAPAVLANAIANALAPIGVAVTATPMSPSMLLGSVKAAESSAGKIHGS